MRKLRKITEKKWVGGVCAGIAYAVGAPTWAIRLVATASLVLYGFGALPYILLWIFMPAWERTPADYETVAGG